MNPKHNCKIVQLALILKCRAQYKHVTKNTFGLISLILQATKTHKKLLNVIALNVTMQWPFQFPYIL